MNMTDEQCYDTFNNIIEHSTDNSNKTQNE